MAALFRLKGDRSSEKSNHPASARRLHRTSADLRRRHVSGTYAFAGTLTYANGALTAVNVNDGSAGFGAFTAAEDVTSNGATLIDYEGRTAATAGSQFFTLAFTTSNPSARRCSTRTLVLDIFGDEGYACASPAPGGKEGVRRLLGGRRPIPLRVCTRHRSWSLRYRGGADAASGRDCGSSRPGRPFYVFELSTRVSLNARGFALSTYAYPPALPPPAIDGIGNWCLIP